MLQLAKLQAAPSTIYTSSKADKLFLDKLHDAGDAHQLNSQHRVRIEKASLFSLDHALRLLQNTHIRGMPINLAAQDRLHYLNTRINLAATQQVCAAGALLEIMHREGYLSTSHSADLVDMPAALSIDGFSEISLDGFLKVDCASMHALQIFQEDRHPSAMGIGQSKEGFSVYGMLNTCVSSMGRKLLRLWFLRPIINLDVLKQRQDAIQFFLHAPDVIKSVKTVLRKTKDVTQLLRRLQSTQALLDIRDFSSLQDSIANLLMLRDMFGNLADTSSAHSPSANSHSGLSGKEPSAATINSLPSRGLHPPAGRLGPHQSWPASDSLMGSASSWRRPDIIQKVLACTGQELLACESLTCHCVRACLYRSPLMKWHQGHHMQQSVTTYWPTACPCCTA